MTQEMIPGCGASVSDMRRRLLTPGQKIRLVPAAQPFMLQPVMGLDGRPRGAQLSVQSLEGVLLAVDDDYYVANVATGGTGFFHKSGWALLVEAEDDNAHTA